MHIDKLIINTLQSPMKWKDFVKTHPAHSIALDGYVFGGPKKDFGKRMINFNHHEEVSRLETRATCSQVLLAIRQGLHSFMSGKNINVYVNDCDQDVCTSVWLLNNIHLVQSTMNPLVNRLVYMEDLLDCTAGAYPFHPDLPTLQHFAWIFYPYTQFRLTGGLDRRNSSEYADIISDVGMRITSHIMGKSSEMELDTRYERLDGGKGWAMVKELGAQARTAMFADGLQFFVSVRQRPDGKFAYVMGILSDFIPINLGNFSSDLNQKENCTTDCWGGGTNIIGSPRINGSTTPPDEMALFVKEKLKEQGWYE